MGECGDLLPGPISRLREHDLVWDRDLDRVHDLRDDLPLEWYRCGGDLE